MPFARSCCGHHSSGIHLLRVPALRYARTMRSTIYSLLLLTLTSACVFPPSPYPGDDFADPARIARIVGSPSSLAVEARLDDSSAMLAANVRVRNKAGMAVRVRYKFTWVGPGGGQVGSSAYKDKEVVLQAFEEKVLRDLAPLPTAVDYRIHLQRR